MKTEVLILGGGAAGMICGTQLKKMKKDSEVTVVEKGEYFGYGACPMPYFISGEVGFGAVSGHDADYFRGRGLQMLDKHEAVSADFKKKTVTVKGETFSGEIEYDKLVIATGASPFIPPIPGIKDGLPDGAFTLTEPPDALKIKKFIEKENPGHAVILGGGPIGLESAEAFRHLGMKATVVELLPEVLGFLSPMQKRRIDKAFQDAGLKVLTGTSAEAVITGKNHVKSVKLSNGEVLQADLLLVGAGVRPNVKFLADCGLPLNEGRLFVDEYLKTPIDDVYAIGDVIWTKNLLTGAPVYNPMGDTADKQALILGYHLSGLDSTFPGVLQTASTELFGHAIAKTGLSEEAAQKAGYHAKSVEVKTHMRIPAFEGTDTGILRAVIDEENNTVLGAVMVGDGAAQIIDSFALLIASKMTLEEIFRVDFAYSPKTSVVWNPILMVCRKAMKK